MNTIHYDLQTGDIVGFAAGTTADPMDGCGVHYTTKDLVDVTTCVVLDDRLVPRLSLEYAQSDKSSVQDKELFWRDYRADLLTKSDYMMLPDVGDSDTRQAAMEYRQKLRELTKHKNWPNLSLDDLPQAPTNTRPKIPVTTL